MLGSAQFSVLVIALILMVCSSCTQDRVVTPTTKVPLPNVYTPQEIISLPSPVARAEPRSKYGNPKNYEVFGKRYHVLASATNYAEIGQASWYGPGFHEKLTSTRESYDMYAMTAAHKTLPIPCFVEVTNLENGKKIVVRVNDRGPFVDGRIIDLSYVAAQKIDMIEAGTARVRVVALTTPTAQVVNYEKVSGRVDSARGSNERQSHTNANVYAVVESPASYTPAEAQIFLQLGAFGNESNALALQSELTALINRSVLVIPDTSSGRVLYKVQVGPLIGANEAEGLKNHLRNVGYNDAKIVESN